MNIHKELEQLRKRIDEIQQQLEPEITEGQYVFMDGFQELHRVVDIDSLDNTYAVVPISDKDNGSWEKRSVLRIASDKEVEQALIKEAKRRGFVKGAKVNSLSAYGTGTIKVKDSDSYVDGIYDYWSGSDRLWAYSDNEGGSMKIYCEGEWAEIIEDEWGGSV